MLTVLLTSCECLFKSWFERALNSPLASPTPPPHHTCGLRSPWWWKSCAPVFTLSPLPLLLSIHFHSFLHLSQCSFSARCASPAPLQLTSHLEDHWSSSHGDQRLTQRQLANIQAGGGGGWWRWEERPDHPVFPENLCARLRSHDRGLVPQTHRDRWAVGHTGWWGADGGADGFQVPTRLFSLRTFFFYWCPQCWTQPARRSSAQWGSSTWGRGMDSSSSSLWQTKPASSTSIASINSSYESKTGRLGGWLRMKQQCACKYSIFLVFVLP